MLGHDEFASMPNGSYFVNVGRGECVDEDALIDALDSEHLAGAALDVFATEPLPDESPLWTMERVLITPHSSGSTHRSARRAEDTFLELLAQTTPGTTAR
jgi:phosphoglycerate dehydrogenase-like enzyme